MISIKNALAEAMPTFYRFQVFTMDGGRKDKIVGAATLREGNGIYALRLWMFLEDRFFLLPSMDDASKFLLMTREPNKSMNAKNKYFWNIVGNAKANSSQGFIELNFDLFERKVFMSIYPEDSTSRHKQSVPHLELEAA